jgi:LysR family transcriptional regulator, nitrogen assimilation regulatory protein
MDIDLRTLDYLAVTARAGNFSAAARALGVTQPSVSRPIRKLEETLGVALFAPASGHRLILTEAGRALLEDVDQLSKRISEMCQRAADIGRQPSGKLTLAAPPAIGQTLLTTVVPEFMSRYPRVQLQVIQAYSAYIEEWLQQGRIDLGIFYGSPRTAEIETSPLLTMEMYLAIPKDRLGGVVKRGQRDVALAVLGEVPLILPGRPSGIRHLVDQAAARLKIDVNVVLEVDHQPLLRSLVARGTACTVISLDGIRDELADGTIHALPFRPRLSWPVSIARSLNRYPSLATVAMSEMLRETADRLIKQKKMDARIAPRT